MYVVRAVWKVRIVRVRSGRLLRHCWYGSGMPIPAPLPPGQSRPGQVWADVEPEREWNTLTTEVKHERILQAAGRLFAGEGLDAPMPAVAALAGASVGSLYRQFPSKRELLAELVIRRLEQTADAATTAAARAGDHWQALREMLWTTLERQAADDFLGDAWSQVEDHERVQVAAGDALASIEQLLELARAEGSLRADASALDIRLVFVAARASRQVEADAWQRLLVLMLDGLAAGR